jgi:molecular chaperone GrpE (heat shock protein)
MGRRSKKRATGKEFDDLRTEHGALEDKHKRALADMANMRRRQAEELKRATEGAVGRVAQEMLPIMDSFELALAANSEHDALLEGMRMVHSMLEDLLGRHGVEPIHAEGVAFDPNHHEAIGVEPRDDVAPNTVVAMHQKGFKLGDRILRPARVVVSQGLPVTEPDPDPEGEDSTPATEDSMPATEDSTEDAPSGNE